MRFFRNFIILMLRRFCLILRFYRSSSMLLFCGAVSVALGCVASNYGPAIIPWLLFGKLAIYPLFLYVYVWPQCSDEFFYYRNLGLRRRWLLGLCCGVDFAACWLLLKIMVLLLA